jgi:hypothetical protein
MRLPLTPGRFRFESIHNGSCALHRYATNSTHILLITLRRNLVITPTFTSACHHQEVCFERRSTVERANLDGENRKAVGGQRGRVRPRMRNQEQRFFH